MDISGLQRSIQGILPADTTLISPDSLVWLFVIACLSSLFVAFGIGANDAANSFGTSFGSGAIRLRYIVIIAGIMEFLGAVSLGSQVSSTIRKGIGNADCFVGEESLLMLVMTSSLIGAGIWLLLASYFGMPVSTTHSTVGAILGTIITSQGGHCVTWGIKGLGGIVLSWLISPILSGILGVIIYALILKFVIKASDPEDRAYKSLPVTVGITIFTILALIFLKSPVTKNLDDWIQWVIIISGTIICIVASFFLGKKIIGTLIQKFDKKTQTTRPALSLQDKENTDSLPSLSNSSNDSSNISSLKSSTTQSAQSAQSAQSTHSSHSSQSSHSDSDNISLPVGIVQIDEDTLKEIEGKKVFKYLQVLTAAFESFAHGANDTANAIGPFVTVYFLFSAGVSTGKEPTPVWALAAGGITIMIGIAVLGTRVMKTIGKKITKIDYTRGFSIELASTLAVVIASRMGMPVSSTHCQIGAVTMLGQFAYLIRDTKLAPLHDSVEKNIKWKLFGKIIISWIVTVPVTGIIASGVYGLLSHFLIQ